MLCYANHARAFPSWGWRHLLIEAGFLAEEGGGMFFSLLFGLTPAEPDLTESESLGLFKQAITRDDN